MNDSRPPHVTENLGRLADDPAADAAALDVDASDAQHIARAVEALEAAVALDGGQIARLLEDVEAGEQPVPTPRLPADYEVLEEIGRGGMGVVYRARQASLDRTVAIKVLRPGELLFGQAMRRFQREARALARLRHPHIVSIHEVGESAGQIWFSMDMIEGRSVADLLREGALSPSRAVRLLKQVAGAVAYVHANGLVHRDLKPANILLDAEGEAVVTDFGLALEIGSDHNLTMTGQVIGTPAYMSPEQARGDASAIGEATDVYAMGAILYECLTGQPPFAQASPALRVYAVLKEDPTPPRRIDRRVPESLERICLEALAKRPGDRYATARAFLEDLERFEEGRAVRATPPSRAWRLGRTIRRYRVPLTWAAGALAFAIALFLLVVLPRVRRDPATLMAAGDALLRDRQPYAALSIYERAREQSAAAWSDPALLAQATEAALQAAERHWHEGKPALARQYLAELLEDGLATLGREGWVRAEEVEWALATSEALDGDAREAALRGAAALEAWNDRIASGSGRMFDAGGHARAEVRVARAVLDALAFGDGRNPDVAHVQLRALARHDPLGRAALIDELTRRGERQVESVPVLLRALVADQSTPREDKYTTRVLIRALRGMASPALERVLARMADDAGEDRWARDLAAASLADLADLPVSSGFLAPASLARIELESEATADAWRRVRALERNGQRPQAWRARMDLAPATWARLEAEHDRRQGHSAEGEGSQGAVDRALHGISQWFAGHSGTEDVRSAEQAEAWWQAHRSDDPATLLASALGLPAVPEPEDAPSLLDRLEAEPSDGGPRREWVHQLLSLTLDADAVVPRWGLNAPRGRDILSVWRSVLDVHGRAGWLHTARFVFREGRWAWSSADARVRPIAVGMPVEMQVRRQREAPPRFVAYALPPGVEPTMVAAQEVSELGLRVELMWSDAGLSLVVPQVTRTRQVPGSSSRSRASGNTGSANHVISPDLPLHSWNERDPFRNEVSTALFLTDRNEHAPLGEAEWRARIASDFDQLARGAEASRDAQRVEGQGLGPPRFLIEEQKTLMNLAGLAARLGLPDALPAMTRLQTLMDASYGLDWQADLLVFARLNAGDESLLETPGFAKRLDRMRDETVVLSMAGRELFWIRLLATTGSERLRELAIERLERGPLSAVAAGDLRDLAEQGLVQPTPALEAKLEAYPAPEPSFLGRLRTIGAWAWLAAGIWLVGLAFLAFSLAPWRGRAERLVPSAWLLAAGFVFVAADVWLGRQDLLPDGVGFLLALLGWWTLTRGSPFRATGSLILGLGALSGFISMGARAPSGFFMGIAAYAIVLTLPALGAWLRLAEKGAKGARAWRWPFVLVYVLPVGLILLGQAMERDAAPALEMRVGGSLALVWVLAALLAVAWALGLVTRGAAVRATWAGVGARGGREVPPLKAPPA